MIMMDSSVVSQCINTLPMSPFMRVESNSRTASPIADAALIKWVLSATVGLPLGTFLNEETGMPVLKEINALFASSPPGCMGLGSTFSAIKADATFLEIVFNSVLVPQFQSA